MRTVMGENPHYKFRRRDPVFGDMRSLWRMSRLSLSELSRSCQVGY